MVTTTTFTGMARPAAVAQHAARVIIKRNCGRRIWVCLHFLRDHKRLAVLTAKHLVGFGIARDAIGGAIEMQRPAEPVVDIRQVHQRSRNGAFFDWRVQVLVLARAQGRDEIGPVVPDILSGGSKGYLALWDEDHGRYE